MKNVKKIIKELEQFNSIFEEYIEKVCSKNFDENLYENNKKLFYNREKEFTIFVSENVNKNQIENDTIDEMKTKIFDNISISKNINKNIYNELQNNLNNINNKTSKNIRPFLFYCETMFKKYNKIFEKNSTDSEKILKSLGDNLNEYENLKDTLNNLNKIENEFMSTKFKYNLLKNKIKNKESGESTTKTYSLKKYLKNINKNKNLTQKEELEKINKILIYMLSNSSLDEKELKKQQAEFQKCLNKQSNKDNYNLVGDILKNIDEVNKEIENNKNEIKKNGEILLNIDEKINSTEKNIDCGYNDVISKILKIYIEKFTSSLNSLKKISENQNLNINKKEIKKQFIINFIKYNNFIYNNKIKFNSKIHKEHIGRINILIEKSSEIIKKIN